MNSVVAAEVLNKPPLCIELVETDPLRAIARVFDSIDFDCFRLNLNRWFHAAIENQNHVYEEHCHRQGLQTLFVDLELLLEALYVIHRNELLSSHPLDGKKDVKEQSAGLDKVYFLTQDQAYNPYEVLHSLFSKFSMIYIRRELNDWLQAGIDIDESDKVQLKAIRVLLTYNDLECLLEAAYHYYKRTVKGYRKMEANNMAML
ncbi:hypothetical protein FAM09_24660 [Niastella caeni]|uniref:Uncharacterized protein n=1 Tax=Niastella caeni TaxID=2569763 RepID=A0A4S8HKI6_9BACT|nr:hypothetical protein [Niastella caeni]THU34214.1 hypothetical protein FAM09_24660 [Niastella caeni]